MAEALAAVQARAALSGGISAAPIYAMVRRALLARGVRGGLLLDVGCGTGQLWSALQDLLAAYCGVDAVRYPEFPAGCRFVEADVGAPPLPLPAGSAAVTAAIEVVEHVENPRALVRELVRLTAPDGWIVVTTPNQLSLLSLATLLAKHRFSAFQDVHYPAHLTALLEVDLRRIAAECGVHDVAIGFSESGRMPLTARHWPGWLSRRFPRALSDTVMLLARRRP